MALRFALIIDEIVDSGISPLSIVKIASNFRSSNLIVINDYEEIINSEIINNNERFFIDNQTVRLPSGKLIHRGDDKYFFTKIVHCFKNNEEEELIFIGERLANYLSTEGGCNCSHLTASAFKLLSA